MLLQFGFETRNNCLKKKNPQTSQLYCRKNPLLYWDSKSTRFTAYSEFQGSAENPTSGHVLGVVSSTFSNKVGVWCHNTALCHKIRASTATPAAVKTPRALVWETWTRISTDGNILGRKLRERGFLFICWGTHSTFWNAVHYYWFILNIVLQLHGLSQVLFGLYK